MLPTGRDLDPVQIAVQIRETDAGKGGFGDGVDGELASGAEQGPEDLGVALCDFGGARDPTGSVTPGGGYVRFVHGEDFGDGVLAAAVDGFYVGEGEGVLRRRRTERLVRRRWIGRGLVAKRDSGGKEI